MLGDPISMMMMTRCNLYLFFLQGPRMIQVRVVRIVYLDQPKQQKGWKTFGCIHFIATPKILKARIAGVKKNINITTNYIISLVRVFRKQKIKVNEKIH